MPAKDLTVSLIVPTKNELEGLQWFLPRLRKEWYDRLIVIDGHSTDGTVEYCKAQGVPVYTQSSPGLTAALVDALNLSQEDIVITLSPDGNSLPELIPALTAEIQRGNDMAIASRYAGGAKSHDDDFFTTIGNKFFTWLINLLFRARYTDALVIYRAYRRQALLRMGLERQDRENWLRKRYYLLNSWELASCARAARLGLKVADVPGDEPKRVGGKRKMSVLVHGTAALLQVLYEFLFGRLYIGGRR